ncbi:uncharacterized protein LOC117172348 isoform X3 [Belonocnema kinseyi]|uniref:uncharacterized protein LOC117172348 isoform X3 n=1 Tax=Belonocnema kinseyi TaxID=2817044 RepID=UPI00143DBAC6|nr:uncharacterized protein LOC117172348 isoform X3 [Belonocnema kinseyi]
MSVDSELSITIKMAPGPEHRQETLATDKNTDRVVEVSSEANGETIVRSDVLNNSGTEPVDGIPSPQSIPVSQGDNKQEEPATLSTLNEGELRALLDEAITYKRPKDREGKSDLFKELLQEAEADETEEGRRAVTNSRCLPGSNRRRHKRDSVSERLTHGGSLQNLAQPINSEFDSSFAYLTSGSSHTYGGGRRKGKKHTGPSVSARQREGGSLPSNVNASHTLASLANLDLVFDKKKRFSEERAVYDWTSKEKAKSLDKPSYSSSKTKFEEKEKEKKEPKRESSSISSIAGACEAESEIREKRNCRGKQGTNEMLESDNPPPDYKRDYMVIDLGDVEVGGSSSSGGSSSNERNTTTASVGGVQQRPRSIEAEEDEGTEMKIIEPRRPVQFITRATFDIAQTPVDTTIEFPFREHTVKPEKSSSKLAINGSDASSALPFTTYNSVRVLGNSSSASNATSQGKVIVPSMYSVMPVTWSSPNLAMETVSRFTAQHITVKDSSISVEKKSLDENGNAVQGYNNGERKKVRRKHTQEPNVIVYKAGEVEGHRNTEDIDSLLNFIENKESKGKKGKTGNSVRVKANSGAKPRNREKDSKREQIPAKLHKSNSLEEISKTKLEDLTIEKSTSSSGASSVSSQHSAINISLRRSKQRSTGDSAVDSRGDRRSWGTEEESEAEPEFLVVTKKKKSKKQRRSSSGSRAQNLSTSGSYLQRSRGFSNDYRTPLSPELRRKSASSMPPSDKSDSSDLDSVHSLPVTSNTQKHNLTKAANSTGGTPQASYADIARMASINMTNSILGVANIVPSVLNTANWPSVPSKTISEPDKLPHDSYPSLDELQHSDRRSKQHNFAHANHVQGLSLSFEKPLSPVMKSKMDSKKAEAREEAFNKNIQVFKYVQDVEKMQQSLTQDNKTSNNSSPNSNETTPTNPAPPKLPNSVINYPIEIDNNNPIEMNKDSLKNTNPRTRRNPILPTPQHEEPLSKQIIQDDMKISQNHEIKISQNQEKLHNEEADAKPRGKPWIQNASSNPLGRSEKLTKALNLKDQTQPKSNHQSRNMREDSENKRGKEHIFAAKSEKEQKSSEQKKNQQRPAVILLDETSSDNSRNSDSSELTFGFEINEQLLLSEESEETTTPTPSPVFSPGVPPFTKPPPNFSQPPPSFPNHVKIYDKFPPNFHMNPVHNVHPGMPIAHVMQTAPNVAHVFRYHPPPMFMRPPPAVPLANMEKYINPPKEDFSARYVAPEGNVNVQNYNHDKIVTFVGLAWEDVMKEMPATTATGRVRYYSGQ